MVLTVAKSQHLASTFFHFVYIDPIWIRTSPVSAKLTDSLQEMVIIARRNLQLIRSGGIREERSCSGSWAQPMKPIVAVGIWLRVGYFAVFAASFTSLALW